MAFHTRYTSMDEDSSTTNRTADFDMRYSPDLLIPTESNAMAPNELDAARQLAKFQQPGPLNNVRFPGDRLNCMLDGQCQSSRTKDCTDACHSCEAPQSCDGGDFCDPRSVCKDPNCQEEPIEDDFCMPCSSHESSGFLAMSPRRDFARSRQNHSQPVYGQFNGSQNTSDPFPYSRYNDGWQPVGSASSSGGFNYHNGSSIYPPPPASIPYNVHSFLDNNDFYLDSHIQPGFAGESQITGPMTPTPAIPTTETNHDYYSINPHLSSDSHILSPTQLTSSAMTRSSSGLSLSGSPRRHSRSSTMSSVPIVLSCRWINLHSFECGALFSVAEDLHEHIIKEHIGPMGGRGNTKPDKEPMICRWSGCRAAEENKRWTALQHVKDHMVCHSGVRETCDLCGKKLRDKKSLKAHKQQCGNESGQKLIPCTVCGKTFSSQSTLKQHMNVHEGKYFHCTYCEHKTTDQSNLRKHMKTHSKEAEGKYRCRCCNKAFRNNFNMKRHEKNMMERRRKDKTGSISEMSTGGSTPGKSSSTPTEASTPV